MTAALNLTFSSFPSIGYMPMPADFPYRKIMQMGRPKHGKFSEFALRHPSMPCSRRAKIFAPFDALKWFDERIAAQEVLYEQKRQLSQAEKRDLNRKLSLLCRLTGSRKAKKTNLPLISVTYFSPCSDVENAAYGSGGTYQELIGTVTQVDPVTDRTITIGGQVIDLEDIIKITEPVSVPE